MAHQQPAETRGAARVDDSQALPAISIKEVGTERIDIDHTRRQGCGDPVCDEVGRASAVHQGTAPTGEPPHAVRFMSVNDDGVLVGTSPGPVATDHLVPRTAQERDQHPPNSTAGADDPDAVPASSLRQDASHRSVTEQRRRTTLTSSPVARSAKYTVSLVRHTLP